MGQTHVTVKIAPLTGRRHYSAEFLVDAGAIDCLVPARHLRRIGIKQEGRDVYDSRRGKRSSCRWASRASSLWAHRP